MSNDDMELFIDLAADTEQHVANMHGIIVPR